MDLKPLQELGLTKGEAKVYLALLEIGLSTTGQIIKVAGVSRSKVYEMLDKLIRYGLVSYVIRDNIRYYDAASPKLLLELLEKRRADLAKQKKNLEQTASTLLQRQGSRRPLQTAVVYEGFEGVRTIYNMILENIRPGEEYFAFQVDPETFTHDFALFIRDYHKKRAQKNIRVKLLGAYETRLKVMKTLAGIKGIELRFTKRPLPTATLIFGDYVATYVWGASQIGVVIQSKPIATRYKKFFVYLWKTAKK